MSCMENFGSNDGSGPARPQSNARPLSQSFSSSQVSANNSGNNKKKGKSSSSISYDWIACPSILPLASEQQLQVAYPQYHRYGMMQLPYAPPYEQHSLEFESSSTYTYVSTLPPASSFARAPAPPLSHFSDDLRNKIVKQIDYYFSDDNLAKDVYLRSKMDDRGWVMITLIASFRRVAQMTKDIQVILDSLRYSNIVEVQTEKLRRRDNWKKWLLVS